jgi:hypothetical protein
MKELLLQIFQKEIDYINFNQDVYVYNKRYYDGEIYETEASSFEPSYTIDFKDGSKIVMSLSELIVKIFNSK